MWLWLACKAPEVVPPTDSPLPRPDLSIEQALAAPVFTVQVSDAYGALSLVVQGGGERREIARESADSHTVMLVGLLPGTTQTITGEVTRPDGVYPLEPLTFETVAAPEGMMPPIETLAYDPTRVDGGWLLFSPNVPDISMRPALLFDEQMRLRWWMLPGDWLSDLRVGPDGALWSIAGAGVERYGWDGVLLSRYTPEPGYGDILLPTMRAHHEVWPLPDGSFLTFGVEVPILTEYPVSYLDLTPVPGEYPVEDDPILHIGADGALLSRWSLVERLDTSRVGFTSLTLKGDEGYDWTHANGLALDADGGVIVSLRNQSAVVRFDAEGALDWIAGDPLGWSTPFAEKLLKPVGELSWFYHQHAPEWHDDEQLLVLFDNHSYGYTPYGQPPEQPLYSRVVGYEIDAVARTMRERFSFSETTTGPLFSRVMGDADVLPNGNLLADFGYLEREGLGDSFLEQGLGRYGVRIVEFDPDRPSEPALDLRIVVDQAAPLGVSAYRVRKIPASLIPPGAASPALE